MRRATLRLTFATATQLAFKWAGFDLEGQEFGLRFAGAAFAKSSVWTAIVGYVTMFTLGINILRRVALSRAFVMTAIVYLPAPLALGSSSMIRFRRFVASASRIVVGVVLINSETSG